MASVAPTILATTPEAFAAVDAWLVAKFHSDPKYQRRLNELEQLYG